MKCTNHSLTIGTPKHTYVRSNTGTTPIKACHFYGGGGGGLYPSSSNPSLPSHHYSLTRITLIIRGPKNNYNSSTLTFCLMFALEETRHATAATAVIQSLSFTKEEVLITRNSVNYSLSRKKEQFCDFVELLLLE